MLPRRVQPALDRWVAGGSTEAELLEQTGWECVWGHAPTLYLPLLHFARMHRLPAVALNVDRDLVVRVAREGWAAVPAAEREGVSDPAPPDPAYVEWLATVRREQHATPAEEAAADAVGLDRFVEAQLTWDRAMAEALAAAARRHPAALLVGLVGSGHLEHRHGVPRQLSALGVGGVTVLLPWDARRPCAELVGGLADAVFGLAPPEGPTP
jgi:uncharacterized iron-regulated protein